MYTRDQIVEMVEVYVKSVDLNSCIFITKKRSHLSFGRSDVIYHISDMLEEIQSYLLDGKPNSKFVERCAEGDLVYATAIADAINKKVIRETTLFQDFVRVVGRERKINRILKK